MSHNFTGDNLFDSFFGAGVDGDITVTSGSPLTLASDKHYNTVIVDTGGVINTNGFKLFAKKLLNIKSGGSINYNAPPANGRTQAAAYGFTGTMGGFPTYGSMGVSGNEGGVINKTGNNTAGQSAQMRGPGVHATASVGWSGGKGGNATLAGGNGGAGSYLFNHWGNMRTFPQCISFKPQGLYHSLSFGSGPGGGSGACDAGGVNDWSGAGGHGGASVGIVAYEVINDGTIECKGGKGGDAAGAVKAGGGGGGAGGSILITTRLATKIGTLDVSGGLGGSGVNGGATGDQGQTGYTQVVII